MIYTDITYIIERYMNKTVNNFGEQSTTPSSAPGGSLFWTKKGPTTFLVLHCFS